MTPRTWLTPMCLALAVGLVASALFFGFSVQAGFPPDPEPGVIRFQDSIFEKTIDGSPTTAFLGVIREDGFDGTVSVTYTVYDGTATRPADYFLDAGDHSLATGTLTWAHGGSPASAVLEEIAIHLTGHLYPAPPDPLVLTVVLSSPTGGAVLGTPSTASLRIVDHESRVQVALDGPSHAVEDSAGLLNFTVGVDPPPTSTITVPISVSGSAKSTAPNIVSNGWARLDGSSWGVSQDPQSVATFDRYTGDSVLGEASMRFQGAHMETYLSFYYAIHHDVGQAGFAQGQAYILSFWARAEVPRSIGLSIMNTNSTNVVADFGSMEIGSDWRRYSFPFTAQSTGEWPVVRFRMLSSSLPITLYLDGLALFQGESDRPFGDYELFGSSPLVFPAGVAERSLEVQVIPDPFHQQDLSVAVSLLHPLNAILGANTHAVFTIVNDDPLPLISVAGPHQVTEDADNATLLASLSHAFFEESVTVDVSYGGTAVPGTHFNGPSTIVFEPGQLQTELQLAILETEYLESDRILTVNLVPPAGAAGPLSGVQHTLNIEDISPLPVANITGPSTVYKSQGHELFTVTLTPGNSQIPVAVDLEVGGTAEEGVDYGPLPASLTFMPGQSVKSVSLDVLDNMYIHDDKVLTITLLPTDTSDPGVSSSIHVLFLHDESSIPQSRYVWIDSEGLVSEDKQEHVATIHLSEASPVPVYVNYATVDGTALADFDYSHVEGVAEIPAGSLSTTVAIPITMHCEPPFPQEPPPARTFELLLSDPVGAYLEWEGRQRVEVRESTLELQLLAYPPAYTSSPLPMHITFSTANCQSAVLELQFRIGEQGQWQTASLAHEESNPMVFTEGCGTALLLWDHRSDVGADLADADLRLISLLECRHGEEGVPVLWESGEGVLATLIPGWRELLQEGSFADLFRDIEDLGEFKWPTPSSDTPIDLASADFEGVTDSTGLEYLRSHYLSVGSIRPFQRAGSDPPRYVPPFMMPKEGLGKVYSPFLADVKFNLDSLPTSQLPSVSQEYLLLAAGVVVAVDGYADGSANLQSRSGPYSAHSSHTYTDTLYGMATTLSGGTLYDNIRLVASQGVAIVSPGASERISSVIGHSALVSLSSDPSASDGFFDPRAVDVGPGREIEPARVGSKFIGFALYPYLTSRRIDTIGDGENVLPLQRLFYDSANPELERVGGYNHYVEGLSAWLEVRGSGDETHTVQEGTGILGGAYLEPRPELPDGDPPPHRRDGVATVEGVRISLSPDATTLDRKANPAPAVSHAALNSLIVSSQLKSVVPGIGDGSFSRVLPLRHHLVEGLPAPNMFVDDSAVGQLDRIKAGFLIPNKNPESQAAVIVADSTFVGDGHARGSHYSESGRVLVSEDILHLDGPLSLRARANAPTVSERLSYPDRVGLAYFDSSANALRVSVAARQVDTEGNPIVGGPQHAAWMNLKYASDGEQAPYEPTVLGDSTKAYVTHGGRMVLTAMPGASGATVSVSLDVPLRLPSSEDAHLQLPANYGDADQPTDLTRRLHWRRLPHGPDLIAETAWSEVQVTFVESTPAHDPYTAALSAFDIDSIRSTPGFDGHIGQEGQLVLLRFDYEPVPGNTGVDKTFPGVVSTTFTLPPPTPGPTPEPTAAGGD